MQFTYFSKVFTINYNNLPKKKIKNVQKQTFHKKHKSIIKLNKFLYFLFLFSVFHIMKHFWGLIKINAFRVLFVDFDRDWVQNYRKLENKCGT